MRLGRQFSMIGLSRRFIEAKLMKITEQRGSIIGFKVDEIEADCAVKMSPSLKHQIIAVSNKVNRERSFAAARRSDSEPVVFDLRKEPDRFRKINKQYLRVRDKSRLKIESCSA